MRFDYCQHKGIFFPVTFYPGGVGLIDEKGPQGTPGTPLGLWEPSTECQAPVSLLPISPRESGRQPWSPGHFLTSSSAGLPPAVFRGWRFLERMVDTRPCLAVRKGVTLHLGVESKEERSLCPQNVLSGPTPSYRRCLTIRVFCAAWGEQHRLRAKWSGL